MLHVVVRGMRIWPPNAAKCCKNAGKFFPDVDTPLVYQPRKHAVGKTGAVIIHFFKSILICPGLIINPIKLVFLM